MLQPYGATVLTCNHLLINIRGGKPTPVLMPTHAIRTETAGRDGVARGFGEGDGGLEVRKNTIGGDRCERAVGPRCNTEKGGGKRGERQSQRVILRPLPALSTQTVLQTSTYQHPQPAGFKMRPPGAGGGAKVLRESKEAIRARPSPHVYIREIFTRVLGFD